MQKLVVATFVSLDGVAEAPEKWSSKFWNDEISKFKHDELFSADALLLGRVTYEGFAASWPSRKSDAYSDRINSMLKYVVSNTLDSAEWSNSRVIRDDVAKSIVALKQETDKDLLVFGSMTLVGTLIQHGLVDEFRLLIYPVVLGVGKRLFKEDSSAKLKLSEVKPYGSDVVLLRYHPA